MRFSNGGRLRDGRVKSSPRQRRLHDGVEFPELDSIALAAAGSVRRGRCLRGARGEQRDGGGGAVRGGEQFDLRVLSSLLGYRRAALTAERRSRSDGYGRGLVHTLIAVVST